MNVSFHPVASTRELPSLDILRGLAVVLMIVNHACVVIDNAHASDVETFSFVGFIGSFAPVLFYFSTGFGIGLRGAASERPAGVVSVFRKVALLLLADQFFAWRHSVGWGLDFFGFIAIATMVVTLVAACPRPAWLAFSLIFCLLLLRYGSGTFNLMAEQPVPWLRWITGRGGIDNVSYPLSPWMTYPLIGFLAARYRTRTGPNGPLLPVVGAATLAVAALCTACMMVSKGMTLFRWGSVSAAYFVISLGVLSLAAMAADTLAPLSFAGRGTIALRGVASFATIPVHYVLLAILEKMTLGALTILDAGALIALLCWLTLASSRAITASTAWRLLAGPGSWLVWSVLLVVAVAALPVSGSNQSLLPFLTFIGQLCIAILLQSRMASRRSVAEPA